MCWTFAGRNNWAFQLSEIVYDIFAKYKASEKSEEISQTYRERAIQRSDKDPGNCSKSKGLKSSSQKIQGNLIIRKLATILSVSEATIPRIAEENLCYNVIRQENAIWRLEWKKLLAAICLCVHWKTKLWDTSDIFYDIIFIVDAKINQTVSSPMISKMFP